MENTKLKKLSKKAGLVALYLFGPVFLMATDPSKLPLPLLIVPFMWLFLVLFLTTYLLLRRRARMARRRVVMTAGVVATLPVLLLVFQSIHQLSLKDVLLSVGLIVATAFYLSRADFIR